jgi:ABC-type amino acid transport substrate-binding protein
VFVDFISPIDPTVALPFFLAVVDLLVASLVSLVTGFSVDILAAVSAAGVLLAAVSFVVTTFEESEVAALFVDSLLFVQATNTSRPKPVASASKIDLDFMVFLFG